MLPQSEITEYGGKYAILNHISDELPNMPIPPYFIKRQEELLDGDILREFNKLKKPIIARSSSPLEYGDYEGIFKSVKNVNGKLSLASAIKQIEASAKSERAKRYAEINGFPLDNNIHTIIQEQSGSKYCGAMMRHPNNPELIFISYFISSCRVADGDIGQVYSAYLFDEKTSSSRYNRHFSSFGIPEKTANFLVNQYKQIESLTDIAEGHSLFVEFGLKPFNLYQARPFKKIETADFELPKIDTGKNSFGSNLVFGITPEDGIVVPIGRSMGISEAESKSIISMMEFEELDEIFLRQLQNLHSYRGLNDVSEGFSKVIQSWNYDLDDCMGDKSYCFMTSSSNQRELFDVDLTIPHMNSLILGDTKNFLVHGSMRLLKKADVTVMDSGLYFREFYQKTTSVDDLVRIISNGKEAVVIRE